MHTFRGEAVNIHHNGDYSGNIIISIDGMSIEIPCEDIFNFVAEYVIQKRIADTEQLAYEGWEAILK